MKLKQLKEFLAALPDDVEVGYRDMNFGGMEDSLDLYDLEYLPAGSQAGLLQKVIPVGILLVSSRQFEYCD